MVLNFFRWIIYIPFGLIVLKLLTGLIALFCSWFYDDIKGFLIIGILFGGIVFLYWFSFLYYYLVKYFVNISPSPKLGAVIFAVFYYALDVLNFAWFFMKHEYQPLYILNLIMTVIMGMISFFAFKEIWQD